MTKKVNKATRDLADKYFIDQCKRLGRKKELADFLKEHERLHAELEPEREWATPRSWKQVSEALAASDGRGFMHPHEVAPAVDLQAIWEHFNRLD